MRTSMKAGVLWLAVIITLILLTGCQPVQPPAQPEQAQVEAQPPEPTEAAATEGETYVDPQGRFSVPVPVNWEQEQSDGYGVLTSPNGGLTVYVMAIAMDELPAEQEQTLEAAVAYGWQQVDPDFALEPDQILDEPVSQVERAITVAYDPEDDERFVLGGGWLYDGTAYIALAQGDLVTVQQRISQLQIALSGYDILALDEVDLSGVDPQLITPDVLDALDAYIENAMAEFGIPGAAVAIVQDDEVVYTAGYGVRDPESGAPVTPETRMMIGSTSKTLTTMLMAMMVDEGLFDWDTPVVEILPTFAVASPDLSQQITVENLVCACTGVPRRDMEIFFNYDTLEAEGVIESLATFEFFTDFGEAFQYSNQMVATGGYVAAAAAGGEYGNLYDAYAELVQERITEPAGMTRTTMDFETVLNDENHGVPHELTFEGEYRPIPYQWERFVTPLAPAGAFWSTAEDMGRYLITELNRGVTPDGERIVSTENLTHTWEPQVPIATDVHYGLGWIISDYKGQRVIAHGGNTIGFTSELAFLPEADIGISVITNAWGTNPFNEAVRGRLLELLFVQDAEAADAAAFVFETQEEQRQKLVETIADEVDPAAVEPYLGRFQNEALGVVSMALEGERLIMDAGEFEAEIRPVLDDEGAVDHYFLYDSPLGGVNLDLSENEAGEPILVLGQGVVEYTFEPVMDE